MLRAPLSIIIPAFNEARRIEATVARCITFLEHWASSWELIVVDDGSSDETAAMVERIAARDQRVRVIRADHGGKGAAVRRGMLEGRGEWLFFADADLSMELTELPRFFEGSSGLPGADISVGSREAPGALRIGEPWTRHVIGRIFNWAVRAIAVRGVQDTQCGYKLFSRRAARALFPRQHLNGFAFDVELLFLAQSAGFTIREVPITWHYRPGTRVRLSTGIKAFAQIVQVRWNALRGRYAADSSRATAST